MAPLEVSAQGARDGIFRQSANSAADCLIRNIESSGLRLTAAIHRAGADREVVVHPENAPSTPVAVWRIREQYTAGSTDIADFLQPVGNRWELIRRMRGDCP